MADPVWKFRVMSRGEMNTDPIESEFFSTEHLDSVADALVRESVQNSLDAGVPGQTVKVSFRLFTRNSGKAVLAKYLKGLQEHINAEQNGLTNVPRKMEPDHFLLIEDYGTRGLEGDPTQDDDFKHTEQKNDFFYFWRNVGRTLKSQADRGRWGLGKTVFQASSRINSFFGMTVRESDKQTYLMGHSVLKTHRVNGEKHCPYGWFGVFNGDFSSPVEDPSLIEQFATDFELKRIGKPGLSVVIPYPDPSVEKKGLASSILLHYFFPILSKDLIVELHQDRRKLVIDDQKVEDLLKHVDFNESRLTEDDFHHLCTFTRWIHSLSSEKFVVLNPPREDRAPKWDESLFPPDILETLRNRFEARERLAIRVPLKIKPEGGDYQQSWFDIFIERDDGLKKPEDHFIREGITIAGVTSLKQKGVRAVISINDKVLSALLGDSENPAHTEWQERSPKFKGKYVRGPSCLRFVKNSPKDIVRIISKPSQGIDEKLLENIFFVKDPAEISAKEKGIGKTGENTSSGLQQSPELVGQTGEISLLKKPDGFKITGNPKAGSFPEWILVTMGYELRGGNPFSKYSPFDFEIDKPPIRLKSQGSIIKLNKQNRLLVNLKDAEFFIEVSGFDPNRDLRVKIETVEAPEQ